MWKWKQSHKPAAKVPEMVSVQLSVSSIRQVVDENSGEEQVCEERDGWCVPGTKDKLRDMISGMVKKVIRAQKPGK